MASYANGSGAYRLGHRQAAVLTKFDSEKIQEEVTGYYVAHEVHSVSRGVNIAVEPDNWTAFRAMPHKTHRAMLIG